jgi:hypothetical protein
MPHRAGTTRQEGPVPTFRLETHDGQHDTMEANRLDVRGGQLVFIQRRDAAWRPVATAELRDVRSVERRFTAVDGCRRYVADRAVIQALQAAWAQL